MAAKCRRGAIRLDVDLFYSRRSTFFWSLDTPRGSAGRGAAHVTLHRKSVPAVARGQLHCWTQNVLEGGCLCVRSGSLLSLVLSQSAERGLRGRTFLSIADRAIRIRP